AFAARASGDLMSYRIVIVRFGYRFNFDVIAFQRWHRQTEPHHFGESLLQRDRLVCTLIDDVALDRLRIPFLGPSALEIHRQQTIVTLDRTAISDRLQHVDAFLDCVIPRCREFPIFPFPIVSFSSANPCRTRRLRHSIPCSQTFNDSVLFRSNARGLPHHINSFRMLLALIFYSPIHKVSHFLWCLHVSTCCLGVRSTNHNLSLCHVRSLNSIYVSSTSTFLPTFLLIFDWCLSAYIALIYINGHHTSHPIEQQP